MTHDDAIAKIRKLLAASTSDNVHESANAAARIKELMRIHGLRADDLLPGAAQTAARAPHTPMPPPRPTAAHAVSKPPEPASLAEAIAMGVFFAFLMSPGFLIAYLFVGSIFGVVKLISGWSLSPDVGPYAIAYAAGGVYAFGIITLVASLCRDKNRTYKWWAARNALGAQRAGG